LAYQYYEDQSLWWVIAKANNLGKGTWYITPGTLIRIPKISSSFDILSELQVYQRDFR
jgi:nucleoid-associated protein YgaU